MCLKLEKQFSKIPENIAELITECSEALIIRLFWVSHMFEIDSSLISSYWYDSIEEFPSSLPREGNDLAFEEPCFFNQYFLQF